MKTTMAAFTVLLLASASAPALAQDKDRDESRHEAAVERGPARWTGQRPERQVQAPRPPAPPEAARPSEAPAAPEAGGGERRRVDRGGGERRGGEGREVRRPRLDLDGDNTNQGLSPADEVDREDRNELREGRRWIGRGVTGQGGGDRRPDADRPRDGNGDGRPDGRWRNGDRDGRDRGDRDGRRRDGDRDGRDGDRRWDRDGRRPPTNHPRWDGRRYPQSYNSRHRYRGHIWRAPVGFYTHLWTFGEILPRGWYAPEYRILDWWLYDLPVPPVGYDWIRVGEDALLVDQFTGRVVQVVRYVFW